MIVYGKEWWGIKLLFRVNGSPFPRAAPFALLSTCVSIALALPLRPYMEGVMRHPYPYSVFAFVLGFILVFRGNYGYQRYWEARTMLQHMSAKWAEAAMQTLLFDELSQDAAAETGPEFRRSFVHAVSLVHCLAVQYLRQDHNLGHIIPVTSMSVRMPPPVDPGSIHDWRTHRPTRSYFMLRASPAYTELYFRRQPLTVIGGILLSEQAELLHADDRVFVAMTWVQRMYGTRRKSGGIAVEAPIAARVYHLLSDGMMYYMSARKIVDTPFPFPYAQAIFALLVVFVFTMPILMVAWIPSLWLCIVFTFLTALAYLSFAEMAREIEDPFRFEPNDLPVARLHHEFNMRLISMVPELLEELRKTDATFAPSAGSFATKRARMTGIAEAELLTVESDANSFSASIK